MKNREYNIIKIPEDNQDKRMKMHRYKVEMSNGATFICREMDLRPNHIYFNDNTQFKVDGDVLDKIEKDILDNNYI